MGQNAGPLPVYLLAGDPGARRAGDPLLEHVLAGFGLRRPSVAYVGAASGDHRGFFLMLSQHLRRCGAGDVTLAALAGRHVALDKTRHILEAADVVFISGGDVEAGMRVLQQKQFVPFLRGLYEAGKPFFGISAGSIMLARQWVRWQDPNDAATAELFPCMGIAPVTCDTHGEADGWEELRALVQLTAPGTTCYGIPAGAGLKVYPDNRLEALGVPTQSFVKRGGLVVRGPDLALP